MQNTIRSTVSFTGVGLHSGERATVSIGPASAGHGIWFKRTDIKHGSAYVRANWDAVNQSPLCTKIENQDETSVTTIEHIMAAMAGCGIHNALVEIDGPEVPILDGSAASFVRGILDKGVQALNLPVQAIKILKPVEVHNGDAWARLEPGKALQIKFHINFEDAAIGVQEKTLNMGNGSFVRELCDSRTFCRQADVDTMRANGLALGGTLDNAVVVDGDKVLSPGGMRHTDEAVRHKMLDALGDLALAGMPILGTYVGHRAGHSLTNSLLRKLFATPDAYHIVVCNAETTAQLPGFGVHIGEIPKVA